MSKAAARKEFIQEDRTKGELKAREHMKRTEFGTYQIKLTSDKRPSLIPVIVAGFTELECKANAIAVRDAWNNTWEKDIDPRDIEKRIEAMKNTLNTLKLTLEAEPYHQSYGKFDYEIALISKALEL